MQRKRHFSIFLIFFATESRSTVAIGKARKVLRDNREAQKHNERKEEWLSDFYNMKECKMVRESVEETLIC